MNNYGYGRFNGPAKHVAEKPKGPVRKFFDLWFENFWRLIPLNVVYSMMSLLILPHGYVSAGLTNVTRNLARDKHTFGLSDFFETAKKNWKQATAAGLINTVLTVLLVFGAIFYLNMNNYFGIAGCAICIVAFMILACMKYYLWVMIITFELPLKAIYRNAFSFVFLNMKKNLLIGLISIAYYAIILAAWLLLRWPIVPFMMFLITVTIYPGFKQLLVQYCVFPSIKKYIIDPYYAEHPEEDVEQRKDLHV